MKYDYLVVGAGLFGAAFACRAHAANKRILVVERRPHVAGNAYTETRDGITVHVYGPHIFHTDDKRVWDFVNSFAEFNGFVNSPVANFHGELFPLPFNMRTFEKLWNVSTPAEAEEIMKGDGRGAFFKPSNLEQQAITSVGREIYAKLIKGYTEKQWGCDCSRLPPSVIKRIPVRFDYDCNYFTSRYQGVPVCGYTQAVKAMLDGVEVITDCDFLKNRQLAREAERVIYTGAIDEYFGYALGELSYRSLRFESERYDVPSYQCAAVVNYTDAETPFTRIVEHKKFAFGKQPYTIITREYPEPWERGKDPFYPVRDEKSIKLYKQYLSLAKAEKNVYFCGRLGEYAYLDMDKTVGGALSLCDRLLKT